MPARKKKTAVCKKQKKLTEMLSPARQGNRGGKRPFSHITAESVSDDDQPSTSAKAMEMLRRRQAAEQAREKHHAASASTTVHGEKVVVAAAEDASLAARSVHVQSHKKRVQFLPPTGKLKQKYNFNKILPADNNSDSENYHRNYKPKFYEANIKFPVTFSYFKKYVNYNLMIDTYIKGRAKTEIAAQQWQEDLDYRKLVLHRIYETYYVKPENRGKFPIQFKPCPKSVRKKILEVPSAPGASVTLPEKYQDARTQVEPNVDTNGPHARPQIAEISPCRWSYLRELLPNGKPNTYSKNNLALPISLEDFKQCSYYQEPVKAIILDIAKHDQSTYLKLKSNEAFYDEILTHYYYSYFRCPSTSEKYKLRLRACPKMIREKMLQCAGKSVEEKSQETQSQERQEKHLQLEKLSEKCQDTDLQEIQWQLDPGTNKHTDTNQSPKPMTRIEQPSPILQTQNTISSQEHTVFEEPCFADIPKRRKSAEDHLPERSKCLSSEVFQFATREQGHLNTSNELRQVSASLRAPRETSIYPLTSQETQLSNVFVTNTQDQIYRPTSQEIPTEDVACFATISQAQAPQIPNEDSIDIALADMFGSETNEFSALKTNVISIPANSREASKSTVVGSIEISPCRRSYLRELLPNGKPNTYSKTDPVLPISLEDFKLCSYYQEPVEAIILDIAKHDQSTYLKLKSNEAFYDEILTHYYYSYFRYPSTSEKYKLRLKACPKMIREKMLQGAGKSVEERSQETQSQERQKRHLSEKNQLTQLQESRSQLILGNTKHTDVDLFRCHQNYVLNIEEFLKKHIANRMPNLTPQQQLTSLRAIQKHFSKENATVKRVEILSVEVVRPADPPKKALSERTENEIDNLKRDFESLCDNGDEKTTTLAYVWRTSYALKERIIRAILDMTFEEFRSCTRIIGLPEIYNDLPRLERCYILIVAEKKVWPPNLYIQLHDLVAYLKSKKVAIDEMTLSDISPKFLHWTDLITVTNYDECVSKDYHRRTAIEIVGIELLQDCREAYYERCWTAEKWIEQVPAIISKELINCLKGTIAESNSLQLVDLCEYYNIKQREATTIRNIEVLKALSLRQKDTNQPPKPMTRIEQPSPILQTQNTISSQEHTVFEEPCFADIPKRRKSAEDHLPERSECLSSEVFQFATREQGHLNTSNELRQVSASLRAPRESQITGEEYTQNSIYPLTSQETQLSNLFVTNTQDETYRPTSQEIPTEDVACFATISQAQAPQIPNEDSIDIALADMFESETNEFSALKTNVNSILANSREASKSAVVGSIDTQQSPKSTTIVEETCPRMATQDKMSSQLFTVFEESYMVPTPNAENSSQEDSPDRNECFSFMCTELQLNLLPTEEIHASEHDPLKSSNDNTHGPVSLCSPRESQITGVEQTLSSGYPLTSQETQITEELSDVPVTNTQDQICVLTSQDTPTEEVTSCASISSPRTTVSPLKIQEAQMPNEDPVDIVIKTQNDNMQASVSSCTPRGTQITGVQHTQTSSFPLTSRETQITEELSYVPVTNTQDQVCVLTSQDTPTEEVTSCASISSPRTTVSPLKIQEAQMPNEDPVDIVIKTQNDNMQASVSSCTPRGTQITGVQHTQTSSFPLTSRETQITEELSDVPVTNTQDEVCVLTSQDIPTEEVTSCAPISIPRTTVSPLKIQEAQMPDEDSVDIALSRIFGHQEKTVIRPCSVLKMNPNYIPSTEASKSAEAVLNDPVKKEQIVMDKIRCIFDDDSEKPPLWEPIASEPILIDDDLSICLGSSDASEGKPLLPRAPSGLSSISEHDNTIPENQLLYESQTITSGISQEDNLPSEQTIASEGETVARQTELTQKLDESRNNNLGAIRGERRVSNSTTNDANVSAGLQQNAATSSKGLSAKSTAVYNPSFIWDADTRTFVEVDDSPVSFTYISPNPTPPALSGSLTGLSDIASSDQSIPENQLLYESAKGSSDSLNTNIPSKPTIAPTRGTAEVQTREVPASDALLHSKPKRRKIPERVEQRRHEFRPLPVEISGRKPSTDDSKKC